MPLLRVLFSMLVVVATTIGLITGTVSLEIALLIFAILVPALTS